MIRGSKLEFQQSHGSATDMSPGSKETIDNLSTDQTPNLPNSKHPEEEENTIIEDVLPAYRISKPPLNDSHLDMCNGVKTNSDDLLVIGIGLMRTGTKSLQTALEQLLGERCYHMTRVFEQPDHIVTWRQACRHSLTRRQCQQLFSGYRATVDMPACVFFRDLVRYYPRAKFVLTVRDFDAWYRSVTSTVLVANNEMKSPLGKFLLRFTPLSHHAEMVDELCHYALGSDLDWNDEALMCKRYQAHIDAVRETIPKDRLLIFNPRDGWTPLCNFLELPVPNATPYPHVNTKDGFMTNWRAFISSQYMKALRRLGLYVLTTVCLLTLAFVIWSS